MGKLLEIVSWAIFALAIFLNIVNLLVISHHGYLVKHFKHPTGIRRTEIKRYSKCIVFLAIIVLILFFTAFLINEDLGVYIFGSFLLKFSIPVFFWIQGWFLPKRLKPQKV